MTLKENVFCEENDEHLEFHDVPIEPIGLVPSAMSTLSLNNLSNENGLLITHSWFTRFSGIIYALIASFIFTSAAFTVKQLGVDLLDAFFLRFIVQTLFTLIFALYKHYSLLSGTGTQIFLQLLCCAAGTGGYFTFFLALRYIELPDLITLNYTRVIWTVVFSIFMYRERPSLGLLIALPLAILGVVFVTQPSFLFSSTISSIAVINNNKFRLLGLTLAIVGAISISVNVISYKQLVSTSKHIKPSVINFQYCFAVLTFLIINQLYKHFFLHTGLSFNYILSWRYILASIVCLSSIIGSILQQKAIKRDHPAVVTLLGSAEIIFALIFQNVFTTKRSNLFALLGSTVVIGSVAIVAISKIINERNAQKKTKLINNHLIIKNFEEKNETC